MKLPNIKKRRKIKFEKPLKRVFFEVKEKVTNVFNTNGGVASNRVASQNGFGDPDSNQGLYQLVKIGSYAHEKFKHTTTIKTILFKNRKGKTTLKTEEIKKERKIRKRKKGGIKIHFNSYRSHQYTVHTHTCTRTHTHAYTRLLPKQCLRPLHAVQDKKLPSSLHAQVNQSKERFKSRENRQSGKSLRAAVSRRSFANLEKHGMSFSVIGRKNSNRI